MDFCKKSLIIPTGIDTVVKGWFDVGQKNRLLSVMQHAWSAPGALQDNIIGFIPCTPPRPQHGHQHSAQANAPDSASGSLQRYPALDQSIVRPRSHPVPMQVKVGCRHSFIPALLRTVGDRLAPGVLSMAYLCLVYVLLPNNWWFSIVGR